MNWTGRIGAFAVLVLCNGCITASLTAIGTAVGAVGSAAATGADAYHLGKIDTAFADSVEECHHAVLLSADQLGLQVKIDQKTDAKNQVWEMTLLDDFKIPVGIHIERRTAHLCRCRVDVGIFGSEPTAHLFMERIRANLDKQGSSKATSKPVL